MFLTPWPAKTSEHAIHFRWLDRLLSTTLGSRDKRHISATPTMRFQTQTVSTTSKLRVNILIPPALISLSPNPVARLQRVGLETFSPVNQNGSFEIDREIKSGYLQKRAQKTRTWKTIFLVLRPNTLYIYRSDKEDKLRHKIFLSDLTAVTLINDPRHKRQDVFGLFSPARNFYLQAPSAQEAQNWVDLIRIESRIEEEEEMLLASPVMRQQSYLAPRAKLIESEPGRLDSSSPDPIPVDANVLGTQDRRPSQADYSGNEQATHSDFSDPDVQRMQGLLMENPGPKLPSPQTRAGMCEWNGSQASGVNVDTDPDRVIWQGWLWLLRNRRGVRSWKRSWAVLRPKNLILYKDESEYAAQLIIPLPSVLNAVETDPVSKTKRHCFQVITDEKAYRFCAHDEETLIRCLGAFKSLLAKRREFEVKRAAADTARNAAVTTSRATGR